MMGAPGTTFASGIELALPTGDDMTETLTGAKALGRAAALMRERAKAATDVTGASDWFVEVRQMHFTGEYGVRSSGGFVCGDTVEEEAEHIASWNPSVALTVADWLDLMADPHAEGYRGPALRVALAYLAGQS